MLRAALRPHHKDWEMSEAITPSTAEDLRNASVRGVRASQLATTAGDAGQLLFEQILNVPIVAISPVEPDRDRPTEPIESSSEEPESSANLTPDQPVSRPLEAEQQPVDEAAVQTEFDTAPPQLSKDREGRQATGELQPELGEASEQATATQTEPIPEVDAEAPLVTAETQPTENAIQSASESENQETSPQLATRSADRADVAEPFDTSDSVVVQPEGDGTESTKPETDRPTVVAPQAIDDAGGVIQPIEKSSPTHTSNSGEELTLPTGDSHEPDVSPEQGDRQNDSKKWFENDSPKHRSFMPQGISFEPASDHNDQSLGTAFETAGAVNGNTTGAPTDSVGNQVGSTPPPAADIPAAVGVAQSTTVAASTSQHRGSGDAKAIGAATATNSARDSATAKNARQAPPLDDGVTQREQVRLIQRISRSFARLGPTGGQINLKLHPPQLGSLNVRVRLEGRSVTASLATESEAARAVITENLPVLRNRLAEQGFEVSQLQVELAENGSDASNNHSQQQSSEGTERDLNSRQPAWSRTHADDEGISSNASIDAQLANNLLWQTDTGIDVQA